MEKTINVKSGFVIAVLVSLICAATASATMTIVMSEGVTGSDGHSRLDGSVSSTIDIMRLGFPNSLNNYVSQVYFIIPEALKASGVVINSATLKIELGGGAYGTTGYTQLYYQLMHLNYDTNTVCVANALATNNAANYTKIGSFNGVTTWDVTSALTADIAAGNTCLPVVVRITDSSGNFIADNTVGVQGYNGSLWASERLRSTPKLTIEYAAPLIIVQSGVAATAIVKPTGATTVETIAANELQYHIEQATGATLGIYTEANEPNNFDGLIYVGACEATAAAGINGSSLDDNGYVIENVGYNLFLAGHDSTGDPLGELYGNNTQIGTMLAVYRFLENYMGVKWLWPGPTGEIIPEVNDLDANGINITGKPVLEHARLNDAWNNWNSYNIGDYSGWTSLAALKEYLDEQSLWMRRQGFCTSISLEYSHAFGTWWDYYHETHLDYFHLLPDDTRRPDPYHLDGRTDLVSMCLSEPNFHQQIVDNWIDANHPEQYINCTQNDTATECTCPVCMSWDVNDPDLTIPWAERLTYATNAFNAEQADWYKYLGSASTRLAKYLLAVQQEANENGYPDANLFAFAYSNCYKEPLGGIQLNDRIIIGVVPNFYFPWTDAKQQEFRNSWSGWADANARVFLRPNYFLDGHNFPIYFADRFGGDFVYALHRGMVATIFDHLTGQWGTQCPNLYMLARVNTHVDANVTDANAAAESILDEFYEAFGPAESAVRAYFDHWQDVSDDATTSPPYSEWFVGADEIFTPSVMATGRTLITNAQTAAEGNEVAVRLVDVLEKGFTHAEKTLAAQAAWEDYDNYGDPCMAAAWKDACEDLLDYRESIEASSTCNMSWLCYCEKRVWPTKASGPSPASASWHGSDGQSVVNGNNPSTTGLNMRVGDGAKYQYLSQTHFEIPAVLKDPNTTITSATLYLRSEYYGAGGTGYTGAYVQLMHLTYDTSRVNNANGNATNDPNLYTKVGSFVKTTGGSTWYNWDVKTVLEADIDTEWGYSPFVTRMTDINGDFIPSPVDANSDFVDYKGFLSSSEEGAGYQPYIEVVTNVGTFTLYITDSETGVSTTPTLSWTPGTGTNSHDVYFGTNLTSVTDANHSSGEYKGNQAGTTYEPNTLNASTTYYWRIDEVGAGGTTKGVAWNFTTAPAPGQASSPSPANSATDVNLTPTLGWTTGSGTTSHNVYFGTDSTPDETEDKGNQAGTTYDPGTLTANATYYWRIDEVGPGGTTTGTVWSFTTIANPPTFVAAGNVASNTVGITPALPTNIASGDILLLFLETANQAISITNQNGGTWTQVANSPQGTGTAGGISATRLTIFWSRYNGTQGAPTTSDSGNHQLGRIIAIRGATASGNPWDVTAGGVEATSDTSGSIPGATTTVGNALVITAIATSLPDSSSTTRFSNWTNANLTSLTERTDNSVTAGNGGGLGIATGIRATTGAYGNTAVTLANAAYKGMMSIAIKP